MEKRKDIITRVNEPMCGASIGLDDLPECRRPFSELAETTLDISEESNAVDRGLIRGLIGDSVIAGFVVRSEQGIDPASDGVRVVSATAGINLQQL